MLVWVNIILINVSLIIVLSLIRRQSKRITELEYEVLCLRIDVNLLKYLRKKELLVKDAPDVVPNQ